MKLNLLLAAGLITFASSSVALAGTCTEAPPSPFGPNDQTGATNRVTAEVTKKAAQEIREGKVIQMSQPLVNGIPLFGTRYTQTILTTFTLAPGADLGKNHLTYMEDTYNTQSHVGTHIDGLGHIGRADCYYNQTKAGTIVGQNFLTKLGLEHLGSFATRGVVVDMVAVKGANSGCAGRPCLDAGTAITAADIQAGLDQFHKDLRPGDVLIIHTGWGGLFEAFPAQNARFNSGEPGITTDAAAFLISKGVVAVGADTWAVEVLPGLDPNEAFPVHQMLITDNGIHIIENVKTDLIAAEAALTRRNTFFFNMTVPKSVGLTGTFVRIDAIR